MNRDSRRDIAVIIPTMRIDEWLSAAVNSVLSQDENDLRVVVAHDGVTPDWSQGWMSDQRVTAICSPVHIGVAGVLAMAIAETTETFVARLDSDDLALPGRFSQQRQYLISNPTTVLVGALGYRIDESGHITGEIDGVTGPDLRRSLLRRNVFVHSSVMFRRKHYVLAGGYDAPLRQMEDYDLWLRMAELGEMASLPSHLVSYRVHSGQMSRGAKPYGRHIRKILSSHRRLAGSLRMNPILSMAFIHAWWVAQWLQTS
jgi:GT2 family glycosyltransferase